MNKLEKAEETYQVRLAEAEGRLQTALRVFWIELRAARLEYIAAIGLVAPPKP